MSTEGYYVYLLCLPDNTPFFVGWCTESEGIDLLRATGNIEYLRILATHGVNNITVEILEYKETKVAAQYFATACRHILRALCGCELVNSGDSRKERVNKARQKAQRPLHRVYYLLDPVTSEVVYIGRSTNPEKRKKQHDSRSDKIPDSAILSPYQQRFVYAQDCKRAEAKAIRKHRPRYNDVHLKKIGRPRKATQ